MYQMIKIIKKYMQIIIKIKDSIIIKINLKISEKRMIKQKKKTKLIKIIIIIF